MKRVPIEITFKNLETIIQYLQSKGAVVVLLGIKGSVIGDTYKNRFEDLSKKYQTAYVSNVLDGILGNNNLMYDALHPNDKGYAKIVDRIFPVLYPLLSK